jgi:hypothetical protein
MKKKGFFKYKNNIYVLDGDITINEIYKVKNENGKFEIPSYSNADKEKLELIKVYVVRKSYYEIDTFETREEAEKLIDYIYNILIEDDDIEIKNLSERIVLFY